MDPDEINLSREIGLINDDRFVIVEDSPTNLTKRAGYLLKELCKDAYSIPKGYMALISLKIKGHPNFEQYPITEL